MNGAGHSDILWIMYVYFSIAQVAPTIIPFMLESLEALILSARSRIELLSAASTDPALLPVLSTSGERIQSISPSGQ